MGSATSAAIYHHVDKNPDKAASVVHNLSVNKAHKVLWVAAAGGNEVVVKLLLEKLGDGCIKRDKFGYTKEEEGHLLFLPNAITIAARNGHTHLLELFHQRNPLAFTESGLKAAYWATFKSKINSLKFILEQGDFVQCTEFSCLFSAAEKGHEDVVRLLLANGADPNHARARDGGTALMVAAQEGHAYCIRQLLNGGADPNLTCSDGLAALMMSARICDVEAVKLLLDAGANILHAHKLDGACALFAAADEGCFDCVKLLLAKGADANQARQDGLTPLYVAAHNGDVKCVDLLLSLGADPNLNCAAWGSPLYRATRSGYKACTTRLLAKGADPNAVEPGTDPAVFAAACKGRAAVLKLLLGAGADPTACGSGGSPALVAAAERGHRECLLLLLKRGADAAALDNKGRSALQMAERNGHQKCCRILQNLQFVKVTPYVKPNSHEELLELNEEKGVPAMILAGMLECLSSRVAPEDAPSGQILSELRNVVVIRNASQDLNVIVKELSGALVECFIAEANAGYEAIAPNIIRQRAERWMKNYYDTLKSSDDLNISVDDGWSSSWNITGDSYLDGDDSNDSSSDEAPSRPLKRVRINRTLSMMLSNRHLA